MKNKPVNLCKQIGEAIYCKIPTYGGFNISPSLFVNLDAHITGFLCMIFMSKLDWFIRGKSLKELKKLDTKL